MSKYIEFTQIPFKGKTKRFEIISKTSYEKCLACNGIGFHSEISDMRTRTFKCDRCDGTGKTPIILGRISWYSNWRQYTFSPAFPTIWNKDCLNDIQNFLIKLMHERKEQRDKDNLHKGGKYQDSNQ